MKLIILMALVSTCAIATEQTHDTQLSEALTAAGVSPAGHRSYQEAYIICRTETAQPKCNVTDLNSNPRSTVHTTAELSQTLSNLLNEYGATTAGHPKYHEANVICRIPKNADSPVCTVEILE